MVAVADHVKRTGASPGEMPPLSLWDEPSVCNPKTYVSSLSACFLILAAIAWSTTQM